MQIKSTEDIAISLILSNSKYSTTRTHIWSTKPKERGRKKKGCKYENGEILLSDKQIVKQVTRFVRRFQVRAR